MNASPGAADRREPAILQARQDDPRPRSDWWVRPVIAVMHTLFFALGALVLLVGFVASGVRRLIGRLTRRGVAQ